MHFSLLMQSALLSILLFVGHSVKAQDVVPGEYLIRFKEQKGPVSVMNKVSGKVSFKSSMSQIGIFHMALKDSSDQATIKQLKNDPNVEYVEPNYILTKDGVGDPESIVEMESIAGQEVQSSGDVNASGYTQNYSDIKMIESWGVESSPGGGTRPIVAIIDTGIDATHTVFVNSGAVWVNTREIPSNGIDDDLNGYVDDVKGWNFITNASNPVDGDGHGTHVAGIVLGAGQDIRASPLAAAKVQIMPLKFLDDNGSGSTSNAINAIYYAVNNGAKVINNSWGGSSYSRALHDALTYAYNRHVLVVSAAGNQSKNNDSVPVYPANYDVPSNISVAATTDADALAYFSNYGSRTVHIGAPGESIESTYPGNRLARMSGTSMAAPLVSGLAALAIREQSSLTGYQVKNLIINSATPVNLLNGFTLSKARVNAYNLISAAKNAVVVSALSSDPSYNPVYQAERSPASTTTSAAATGGCGTVAQVVSNSAIRSGALDQGGIHPSGVVAALFMIPLFAWALLRRKEGHHRRRHDRFKMESKIRVMVGGQELVADMKTISVGGLSFNTEQALDKGGIVTLKIASPDGSEMVEVNGHVVWNKEDHTYGVAFDNVRDGVRSAIRSWTRGLIREN